MTSSIKGMQSVSNTRRDIELKLKKAPYANPVLRVYGVVSQLTKGSGGSHTDGSMVNKAPVGSDRRIKENITWIGTHPLKVGLYLFNYKPEFRDTWGHGRQFGVMADEVEKVMPEAVSIHPNGYKMVDYAMLGISRNLH